MGLPSSSSGGGFFGGMSTGINNMQNRNTQQSLMKMLEGMNQNFGRTNPQMQGPVMPLLRNQMWGNGSSSGQGMMDMLRGLFR